jgi:Plasmid pRiA4b ORF-3-like protein
MPASKTKSSAVIYQLKISLYGSKPPIWRRVQVNNGTTLAQLHNIIQEAMGWYDYHLHSFTVNDVEYGQPDPSDMFDMYEVKDERQIEISRLIAGEKAKFSYLYDFGDSWEHVILVEKILPADPTVRYPICVKGKGACPPEDCGGIWSYYDGFLAAIKDPEHPEHEEMLEWIGGEFDPDYFDLDEVNRLLAKLENP